MKLKKFSAIFFNLFSKVLWECYNNIINVLQKRNNEKQMVFNNSKET